MSDNNQKTQAFALNDMKEQKPAKKVKKKKERLGPNWFLIIVFLLVCIPVGVFGYILYNASQEGNVPILGDRFLGDLDPAITEEDMTSLEADIQALENVEKVSVNCIVATMRITVDAKDDLTRDQVSKLTKSIYDLVDAKLPIASYFTSTDTQKQYDLEINVYNDLALEDSTFIMYSIVKNGPQEKYILQDVSTPLNAELAKELWEYVEKRDAEAAAEEEEEEQPETAEDMYTEQEEPIEPDTEGGSETEGATE